MKDTPLLHDEDFYKSMATSNDYDGRLYCKECLKLGVETDPIVGVLDLKEAADWGVIIYNEDGGADWSLDEPSGWANKGLIPPWSDSFFGPGDEEILNEIKGSATSEGYCLRHWAAKVGRSKMSRKAESKFDKLAKEIAEDYEDKGKSPQEAMEIGEATAAKIGRAKFGKRKFAKMGQKAEFDKDFDMDKADRNKDGKISDWEQAVGNKVAKGIRESDKSNSKDSVQAVLDGYRAANKGSLMILTPIIIGVGLLEIYKRYVDKPESSEVSAAEVSDNSETSEPFDRMPGATQIVDNMVQRRKANNVLFEKNAPTLWPSGGLTVVNMIDAIQRGDNLPEFPTTKI